MELPAPLGTDSRQRPGPSSPPGAMGAASGSRSPPLSPSGQTNPWASTSGAGAVVPSSPPPLGAQSSNSGASATARQHFVWFNDSWRTPPPHVSATARHHVTTAPNGYGAAWASIATFLPWQGVFSTAYVHGCWPWIPACSAITKRSESMGIGGVDSWRVQTALARSPRLVGHAVAANTSCPRSIYTSSGTERCASCESCG